MKSELLTERDDLVIRRHILEPGEAMPWHTDACHRFSVLVRGNGLTIEFRDTGEFVDVAVYPGLTGWDAPESRVHRGINTGSMTYEEVVMFFRDSPQLEPQPEHR
jgi:oxalate decarboxylase/phosphoglucose isomerase-like protein (cupin superfamily)